MTDAAHSTVMRTVLSITSKMSRMSSDYLTVIGLLLLLHLSLETLYVKADLRMR